MNDTIEIVDRETEVRRSRQRKVLIVLSLLSFGLFGYPLAKHYQPKWQALRAARKLSLFLTTLKTRAILKKTPLEARFRLPNIIEVSEVSSCGPNAQRKKLWETSLAEWQPSVEFLPESWVREQLGSKEPILYRLCYDPLYGSSMLADGLAQGGIFLAHQETIQERNPDHAVQVIVEGTSAELEIE